MHLLKISLAVLLLATSAAAADAPVAALAEAYDNPTVGASAPVSNLTINLSKRMKVTLVSGNAAPVMGGSDQIGLFFAGNGTVTYLADDPDERVNVRFNAKKASDYKVTEAANAITLQSDFRHIYIRAAGIELPKLTGSGGALDAEFKAFRENVKVWSDTTTHGLIQQKLDAPTLAMGSALFDGSQTGLWYLDGMDSRSEALLALRKMRGTGVRELSGYMTGSTISEAPVGRNRRDFVEPRFLLTDLDYTLVHDQKEHGILDVTETLMPRTGTQSVFRLDLYSMTFDSNMKPRAFNVRSVTDAAGNALSFDHRNNSILVGLPKKAAQNQPIKVNFRIDGDFLIFENANSAWQLGTEPWFPLPDLNGQYYTVHSVVKVKKPFVAFAPGTTIRSAVEGDYNVIETRIDKPVQFAVAHGGRYYVDTQTYDDGALTIRVASYGQNNPRAMKQLSNLAWKMIKFYEPFLGPFPFKEFNIIEINELGYAQAPPATMFITKEAFNPTMGDDNKLFSKGINDRFAHEIAHQYWGHVVKMGSGEEQWVTESFAEYSSSLVVKQLKGKSGYDAMVATWRANAGDAKEVSSIPLANRISIPADPGSAFRYRTFLVYDKGAYVLSVLHKQLGEDKFLTFLRSLQGFFAWKFLTTPDMVRLLDRIEPGKDWKGFFDKYYYGTEMPKG
jgi:hypothetical protein